MKRRRALAWTLALAGALVAAVVGLRRPYASFLARQWRDRLATVPEERVDVLLEGIARLGEPGIPVLVEALGSKRQSVAGGARRVLAKEMERWGSLRAKDYSPRRAILAEAWADQVDQFDPGARADAADLAARILSLWTLDETVVDPAEVIACCEKVLRTPNPQRPLLARRPSASDPADRDGAGGPLLQAANPLRAGVHPADRQLGIGQETASALESSSSPPPDSLPPRDRGVILRPIPIQPERLEGEEPTRSVLHPLRPPSPPDGAGAIPEHPAEPSGEAELSDVPRLRTLRFLSDGIEEAVDLRGGRFDSMDAAALDTVELMRRLQAGDNGTVERARAELARRGFTEVHLGLARQLFDPDPAVRARLGRVLLALPNVDAVPWLAELSRDEDPEVRLAAITLMATTGDPALLKAVEKTAREDPDPRVQEQAERMAGRRRAAGY